MADKVSSSELFRRFDAIDRVQALQFSPMAMYVYKPNREGTGSALKVQLRLTPAFNDKGYVSPKDVTGGLFVELAKQDGTGEAGFAKFGWDDAIVVKLGLPDIGAFLLGLRSRVTGKPIPQEFRDKKDEVGVTVSRFHKTKDSNAVIGMKFEPAGSFFGISKPGGIKGSIKLNLAEEIELESYLRMAMQAHHVLGA